MKKHDKPKSLSDIQLDQFLRELETDEGRKRIGDEAYEEAKAAEKRQFIPTPSLLIVRSESSCRDHHSFWSPDPMERGSRR